MSQITHFSYTQLDTFLKCPERYRFRYLEHIRTPVSGDLIRGDAYHKAIAFAYGTLIAYRKYPSIEEVVSVFCDIWDKRLADRVTIDEGEDIDIPAVDFRDKDPGKMKDDGIVLVQKYYDTVLKRYIPDKVEVKKTTIYNSVPLISYIDLITFDGIVIDHKFSKKRYSDDEILREMQSTFYAISMGKTSLDFEIHQALATKKPDINVIPIKRTSSDIDWLGRVITSAWRIIQSGNFCPSPMGWWCSKNYCEFYAHCRMPRDF